VEQSTADKAAFYRRLIALQHTGINKDAIMDKVVKLTAKHLNFYYSDFHALQDISLEFLQQQVTALIDLQAAAKAPSCGA